MGTDFVIFLANPHSTRSAIFEYGFGYIADSSACIYFHSTTLKSGKKIELIGIEKSNIKSYLNNVSFCFSSSLKTIELIEIMESSTT